MPYLVYNTEDEAIARATAHAQEANTSYYQGDPDGSRFIRNPIETSNGKWAYDVSGYATYPAATLTEDEEDGLFQSITPKPIVNPVA